MLSPARATTMATGSIITIHLLPPPSSHHPISFTPTSTSRRRRSNVKLLSPLYSQSPSPSSPPPIFLSFLEDEEEEAGDKREEIGDHQDDPIYTFFRSRTSTRQFRWHLADTDTGEEEGDRQFTLEKHQQEQKQQQLGQLGSGSDELKGVVREIFQLARNLPPNTTLGEQMEAFEGRFGEEECVEALKVMASQGLLLSCLYLFEWMRIQEPSLLNPRACSLFFPLLGKAGMGDKVIILWRNLPPGR